MADAVADRLDVEGAACVLTAAHGCMTLRGVMQPDARTTTVSLSGGWTENLLDVRDTLSEHRAAVAGWKMSPRKPPTHGHPPAEGNGRASPRLRRTKGQRDHARSRRTCCA